CQEDRAGGIEAEVIPQRWAGEDGKLPEQRPGGSVQGPDRQPFPPGAGQDAGDRDVPTVGRDGGAGDRLGSRDPTDRRERGGPEQVSDPSDSDVRGVVVGQGWLGVIVGLDPEEEELARGVEGEVIDVPGRQGPGPEPPAIIEAPEDGLASRGGGEP